MTAAAKAPVTWPQYCETHHPSPVDAFLREIRGLLVACDRDPYFAEHITSSDDPCWHLLVTDDPDAPTLRVLVLLNTATVAKVGVRVRAFTAQAWGTAGDPYEDFTLTGWPDVILAECTRAAVARLLGRKQVL